ncbi:MAG: B12-binding domain-containing radical SAM protein [Spirochaetaceae bacterium]|nr:B12-binding domain-containing radical SAM protein [Spirochaetaceae bacterium]
MILKKRKMFRIFIPRFPNFNIYSLVARTTTSVGPLFVATSAARLDCWDVEVIDENNLHGKYYPRKEKGVLDHQALQNESPADIVGFYGSITSSIPRLFELARFYKSLDIMTIAGGKHVENLPEEALSRGIDYVVFGEGEITIRNFLMNFDNSEKRNQVKGIGYLVNKQMVMTEKRNQINALDRLPIPDYQLLRFGKMKLYPIVSTRGCNSNCEFCAVKGKSRSCTPEHLLNTIKYLVEKYKAKSFFEVSDHFASNMKQAIRFLKIFTEYQKTIKKRLRLTVQTRITDARSEEYLAAIKKAGVETLCIGFESPIDEDLKAMNKGYLSKDMMKWTRLFKDQKVRIHGMFIFAYPQKDENRSDYSIEEKIARYWDFIKKSHLDTLQLLLAIPLPGTRLRTRLENNNQLFSIDDIGWEYYDGQFPLYSPGAGIAPEVIQNGVGKLMKRFYHRAYFLRLVKNISLDFPLVLFPSVFTLFSGKVDLIKKAFYFWYRKFYQNNLLCFGGLIILRNWMRDFRKGDFLLRLAKAKKQNM